MTRRSRIAGWIALIVFLTACMALVASSAQATDCPQGIPRCKVLVLTPDMEQALVGQNMILDTAEWGNRAGLSGAVVFFRKAIIEAPAGTVPKPAAQPEPPK